MEPRKTAVLFTGFAHNYPDSVQSIKENLLDPNDADAFVLTLHENYVRRVPSAAETVTDWMANEWAEKNKDQERIVRPIDGPGEHLIANAFGERLKAFQFAEEIPGYLDYLGRERRKMMDLVNRFRAESFQRGLPLPYDGQLLTNPDCGNIRAVSDQFNHVKRGFELMEAHERARGSQYEIVARVRLDFMVDEPLKFSYYYLNQDQHYLHTTGSCWVNDPILWCDEFCWFSHRDMAQRLFPELHRMGKIVHRKYPTIHPQQNVEYNFSSETQFALLLCDLGIETSPVRIQRSARYTDGGDGYEYLNYRFRRDKISPEYGLDWEFRLVCKGPSDINEHLPVLREYAEKCSYVIELGTRYGNSTVALMAARPANLVAIDPYYNDRIEYLKLMAQESGVDFEFRCEYARAIEETDLLFIDTNHHQEQCEEELRLFAEKVRKYLIFHDTTTFWERGQGHERGHGLRYAIEPFLAAHPEWRQVYRAENNNGLLILERRR